MAHFVVVNDVQRSPRNTKENPAVIQHRAVSRFYREQVRDRLIYGLAIFIFVVAPFGLMFVAAPIAVAVILASRPDGGVVVPSEAEEIYRLRHAPWSTTGLRRQP